MAPSQTKRSKIIEAAAWAAAIREKGGAVSEAGLHAVNQFISSLRAEDDKQNQMTPRERHRNYSSTFEERAAQAKKFGDKMTADGVPWERVSWVYPDISIMNGENGTEIIRHEIKRAFLKKLASKETER